jgi:hypothetical protein
VAVSVWLALRRSADTTSNSSEALRQITGTVQQYTHHVDFLFRFAGLVVYCQKYPGPNLLLAPLSELLESQPDLLHKPKFATDWAELIKGVVPHGSELHERLSGDYVGWSFRNRAALMVKQFGMVIIHGHENYYMFSRAS